MAPWNWAANFLIHVITSCDVVNKPAWWHLFAGHRKVMIQTRDIVWCLEGLSIICLYVFHSLVCKEGYYLSGSTCRVCPVGEHKESIGNSPNCTLCELGTTTLNTASTNSSQCCKDKSLILTHSLGASILYRKIKRWSLAWRLFQDNFQESLPDIQCGRERRFSLCHNIARKCWHWFQ